MWSEIRQSVTAPMSPAPEKAFAVNVKNIIGVVANYLPVFSPTM